MSLVCREIFEEFCILASGDVVCGCEDAHGERSLGNVMQEGVYDVFRGEGYKDLRRLLKRSRKNNFCPSLKRYCQSKCVDSNQYKDHDFIPIRKIRLETISFCNLRCPSCPSYKWYQKPPEQQSLKEVVWRYGRDIVAGRSIELVRRLLELKLNGRNRSKPSVYDQGRRLALLPLDTVKNVLLNVKDTLREIWLYNYGEPFLDKRLLDIMRLIRSISPASYTYIHTNGNFLPNSWREPIIRENLLDHISFSIDGTCQESYEKYRVGGRFVTAFENMIELAKLKHQYKQTKPLITWQYILFEWNDSAEEIRKAEQLAAAYDLELIWIITHSKGRSQRFTADSVDYKELHGIKHYSGEMLAKLQKQVRI